MARVATVFLTGRECPWRCVMCDLWRYTTVDDTPAGAIPAQIAAARRSVPSDVTQMKLYNAGSFFDPRAVPEQDYDDIAAQLTGLSRVIVECHPALVGPRVDRFLSALDRAAPDRERTIAPATPPPRLEVAMGLETAHPAALEKLHKRFTLDDFARAADYLRQRGVALRVFLLISPPFVPHDEQDAWLSRSIDFAFACGASAVSLIPTRSGNGALEALADVGGACRPPTLDDIERSAELGLPRAIGETADGSAAPAGDTSAKSCSFAGRMFVDLWNLDRFAPCPSCRDARRARLQRMNLEQALAPRLSPCPACAAPTPERTHVAATPS